MEYVVYMTGPYIIFAGITFSICLPLVKDFVSSEGNMSKTQEALTMILVSFFWPLTVMGMGFAWMIATYITKKKAQAYHIINNIVERSGITPVGKDQWREFVLENIKRVPRSKLYIMMLFDVDVGDLDETEMSKIISSEMADRDLFNNRF